MLPSLTKPIFTEKEIKDYPPLAKAIGAISEPYRDGIVGEYSEAIRKSTGITPQGFFVPIQALKKALGVSNFSSGGAFLGTSISEVFDILRPRSVVLSLGAVLLDQLRNHMGVPRQTGTQTMEWGTEIQTANLSDATLGQAALAPRRGMVATSYSKQFLIQGGAAADAFVTRDLLGAIAVGLDKAAIAGTGNAQPVGLLASTGTNLVTFGGAATFAKIVNCERQLGDANADIGSLGWITSVATREKWRLLAKNGTGSDLVWSDGKVNDSPAFATNQLSASDRVIHGKFDTMVIGMWGQGIDIVSNPYTLDSQGIIRVVVNIYADVALPFPQAFTISTDSGAV
jgi:HK97 family phage major capsid protein